MTKLTDDINRLTSTGAFDAVWYVQRYPDVLDSGMTPVEHYVRMGQHIGRKSHGCEERSWEQPEAYVPKISAVPAVPAWPPLAKSDDIDPYKQYEAEVIIGGLEGFITCETIGFEDYPCEMTMVRWQAQDWTTEVVLTKRSC